MCPRADGRKLPALEAGIVSVNTVFMVLKTDSALSQTASASGWGEGYGKRGFDRAGTKKLA